MAAIFEQRRTLKDVIWLWELCKAYSKYSPEQWWPVSNGQALSDELIAENLEVSAATVRRWRIRLEKNGFIRSFPAGSLNRRLEMRNINFVKCVPAPAPEVVAQIN